MNKAQITKQIVARLSENLHLLQKAARASHAEATHESSKAENKYDTRGLEAAAVAETIIGFWAKVSGMIVANAKITRARISAGAQ